MKTLPILYENAQFVVINKPAGLAVQGGSGIVHSVDTVLATQLGQKVFPVHRLDKDTAGLLAVAKTSDAARMWMQSIAPRAIKEYAALCIGKLNAQNGVLVFPAGKKGSEKDARTEYRVEQTIEKDMPFSFVRLTLCTGRMHQIRTHLSLARCPIAADDKYGNFEQNRALKKIYGIKKLQLAAVCMTFIFEQKPVKLEIPPPEHMMHALEQIF